MGRRKDKKKTFKCSECTYACYTAEVLAVHLDRYHANADLRPFACNVCSYRAKTSNVLKVHKYLKHESKMPLSCTVCNMPFKTRAAIRDHMPVHTGTRAFSCVHCGFTTKFRAALYKHIHNKHSGSTLTSSVIVNIRDDIDDKELIPLLPKQEITETTEDNVDSALHQDIDSNQSSKVPQHLSSDIVGLIGRDPIICPECSDAAFATMEEYDFHLDCHRKGGRLTCPYCLCPAVNWTTLQQHFSMHPEVPTAFTLSKDARVCKSCSRIFENFVDNEEHQKFCELPDNCIKNEYSEATLDACTLQEILQQAMPKESLVTCNVCEMVFTHESHLKYHQIQCHRLKELLYNCACGREVRGSYAWLYHSQYCGKPTKSWPCSQCSFVATTMKSFHSHYKRVHEKPHKCPNCPYACHCELILARHIAKYHQPLQPVS